MNTPAHLVFGAAAFARPQHKGTFLAALIGSALPDLSLYLMVAWSIWMMDVPAQVVFREYYYSDTWQSVFAVDNSFVLWGILLAIALWRRWHIVVAVSGAALLHIALDFPLHTHDARQHLWPISDWVFHSPYSYWDSRAGANIIGPVELGLTLVLALVIFARFRSLAVRATVALLVVFEVLSSGIWRLVF